MVFFEVSTNKNGRLRGDLFGDGMSDRVVILLHLLVLPCGLLLGLSDDVIRGVVTHRGVLVLTVILGVLALVSLERRKWVSYRVNLIS